LVFRDLDEPAGFSRGLQLLAALSLGTEIIRLRAVSTEDRTINPDLERFMAKRMGDRRVPIDLDAVSHSVKIKETKEKAHIEARCWRHHSDRTRRNCSILFGGRRNGAGINLKNDSTINKIWRRECQSIPIDVQAVFHSSMWEPTVLATSQWPIGWQLVQVSSPAHQFQWAVGGRRHEDPWRGFTRQRNAE
jgi:hypothetical protein